jgi:hypothetical protein
MAQNLVGVDTEALGRAAAETETLAAELKTLEPKLNHLVLEPARDAFGHDKNGDKMFGDYENNAKSLLGAFGTLAKTTNDISDKIKTTIKILEAAEQGAANNTTKMKDQIDDIPNPNLAGGGGGGRRG